MKQNLFKLDAQYTRTGTIQQLLKRFCLTNCIQEVEKHFMQFKQIKVFNDQY